MAIDCTKEFEELKPLIKRFGFVVVAFFVIMLVTMQFLHYVGLTGGLRILVSALWVPAFLEVIKRYTPRCPNCKQSLYAVVEYKGYPIVCKSSAGKNCWGCGAKFK